MLGSEQIWQSVDQCPACGNINARFRYNLPNTHYLFGKERLFFPDRGIAIVQCDHCKLVYKDSVPIPTYLVRLFNRNTDHIWVDEYHFLPEKVLIESLVNKPSFDLLDIGPAHGGLLKACGDSKGKRSALDIVQHVDINNYLRGEFIQGLLEAPTLTWKNKPYDIVTAFDVFEHLYQPDLAFANLRQLVKRNGFVILETGDISSFWPRKFGIHEWWYVNLLEHHLFWSEHPLKVLADQNGFKVMHFIRKRHKNRVSLPFLNKIIATLKSALYYLSPDNYKRLMILLEKSNIQPFCLFAKDHFRAILKKI